MRPGAIEHGGDLTAIRQRFPHAPEPWIDLSTGINPHAYPAPAIPQGVWRKLPDALSTARLNQVAARYYGVETAQIVAVPGTQALIQCLPFLRMQKYGANQIAITGPTYDEHSLCWQRAGHQVRAIVFHDAPRAECDVLVLVNPNNPDGRLSLIEDLILLARRQAQRGGWLVLDEAFMDCMPEFSFCPHLSAHPNVILLRSFGKFFGLAGLRLGFGLGAPALIRELCGMIGPWAVSGPACAIGAQALSDTAWAARTRTRLSSDAVRRDAIFMQHGLRILGAHPLFSLLELPQAEHLFQHLAQHGIYVRRFDAQPHWLRAGALPAGAAERLKACLRDWKPAE